MTRSLLFPVLLLALASSAAFAQTAGPLSADPGRARAAGPAPGRRPAALTLPFFDDFATQTEGEPSQQRWAGGGGALVNNRFPVAPPTRNVATLDGLRANGQPYGSSSAYSDTDTLTSQPLDLSGFTAADNIYLSFFWQSGSVVGPAKANSGSQPVLLELEFLDRNQAWQSVWQQLSTGQRTDFQQQLIAVTQPQYLHGAFQFRFRATGNLATTTDAWSLDYVQLDRNRAATAGSYRDIATSAPLGSLLKRYAAMPVWQYNAAPAPAAELNDQTSTTINNLDAGPAPTPVSWTGTVRVLPDGAPATFLTGSKSLNASARQDVIAGSLRPAPLPVTAEPKRIRHQITLQTNETNPRTLPNDTISRVTELSDYYAYDDGTAEGTFQVSRGSTGPASYFVYRIDLNKPDQVRGLRLFPLPSPTATSQGLAVAVWAADATTPGQPAATPLATRGYAVPATLPAGELSVDVNFPAPVPVSGTFYIGYAPNSQYLQFGADFNSTVPAGYLLSSSGAAPQVTWTDVTSAAAFQRQPFTPMMRPLMTNGVATPTTSATPAAALSLYPNPSTGRVRVQGRYRAAVVLDALGRVAWQQPPAQAGQPTLDLRALPAGLYLVRLTLPDGATTATKRLVITK